MRKKSISSSLADSFLNNESSVFFPEQSADMSSTPHPPDRSINNDTPLGSPSSVMPKEGVQNVNTQRIGATKRREKKDRKQISIHLWPSEMSNLQKIYMKLNSESPCVERSEIVALGIEIALETLNKVTCRPGAGIDEIREAVAMQLPNILSNNSTAG
jgi:hypothetical protein